MRKITQTFLVLILIGWLIPSNAQQIGDFRSKASGNWGNYLIWQVYNGTSWVDATASQIPGGTNESDANNTYIEAGHTVTLEADHNCKDLHLNTTADVVRINTQDNILNVWGKMRFYTGTAPGANPSTITTSGITGWISTGSNGYIRFRGTVDRVIMEHGQVNANNTNSGWNLDFALNPGITGQLNDRIRAGNITVSSGVLFINNPVGELRVGTNNGGTTDFTINGRFLIKSGATLKGGVGVFKKSDVACESFTLENGGNLIISNSPYVLAAANLTLNGNVILQNVVNFPYESGRTGASPINNFSNLTIEGAGAKTLKYDITVNGKLTIKDTASFATGSYVVNYGTSGELEYAGTKKQTTTSIEFPSSASPSKLTINNPNGVSLHASRTIGGLSLTNGLVYLGSSDLTLSASSGAVTGSPSATNMVVTNGTGKLIKIFDAPGSFIYPIGDTTGTDDYSFGQIQVNSAAALNNTTYMGVRVVDTIHPAANTANGVSRYWEVSTNMSGYSYNGNFQYLASDVVGNESMVSSYIFTDASSSSSKTIINTVDYANHLITFSNLAKSGYITGAYFACNLGNNSISTSQTTFCTSTSSFVFDGTTPTSSGQPIYQWQTSINSGDWTDITSNGQSEDLTHSGTFNTGTYKYRRIVSDPTVCLSNIVSNEVTITVNPNSITLQPGSTTICAGQNTTLTVAASGSGLTYKWQYSTNNGSTFSDMSSSGTYYNGGTTSSLNLVNTPQSFNNYQFRCIITGVCGAMQTNAATLNVTATTITVQPINKTVCTNGSETFSITATGTSLSYQWQESVNGGSTYANITDGGIYSGATTNVLSLTGISSSMNSNKYKCLISSICDLVTSNTAVLTVTDAMVITSHPQNAAVCAGQNTTLTVASSGLVSAYKWQYSTNGGSSFSDLSPSSIYYNGTTTSTLNLVNTPSYFNNYQFRCVLTSPCGISINSNLAVLTVGVTTVTVQPVNKTVCAGGSTTFNITTTGVSLSYQWQESVNGGSTYANITDGGVYSGSTTSALSLTGILTSMNSNKYRCLISSICDLVTSNAVVLTVTDPVLITSHPQNTVICAGQATTLTVAASGTGITYKWQYSTNGGSSFSDLSSSSIYYNGTTASTLNLVNTPSYFNNYQFRCVLTSSCGISTNSNAALLTVGVTTVSVQPANKAVCTGGSITFNVSATGVSLSYQWQESIDGGSTYSNITDGGVYSGSTTSILSLTNVPASKNSNKYRCLISSVCSPIASNAAILSVNDPILITSNPQSTSVCPTQNTSLTVSTSGLASAYKWQYSTNNGSTFSDLASSSTYYNGGTTSTLNLINIPQYFNKYQFRCKLTSSCGDVTYSSSAILTVNASCREGVVEEPQPEAQVVGYPNPFSDGINISFKGFKDDITVTVKDLDGKILIRKDNVSSSEVLTVGSELSSGLYLVEIWDNNNYKVLKIMKTQ